MTWTIVWVVVGWSLWKSKLLITLWRKMLSVWKLWELWPLSDRAPILQPLPLGLTIQATAVQPNGGVRGR